MSTQENLLFGSDAIAVYLGIDRRAATRLLAMGRLPGKKIGRQWTALKSEIEAAVSAREQFYDVAIRKLTQRPGESE